MPLSRGMGYSSNYYDMFDSNSTGLLYSRDLGCQAESPLCIFCALALCLLYIMMEDYISLPACQATIPLSTSCIILNLSHFLTKIQLTFSFLELPA